MRRVVCTVLELWCGGRVREIRKEVEDVLEVAEDRVVNRQFAIEDFLKVLSNVS